VSWCISSICALLRRKRRHGIVPASGEGGGRVRRGKWRDWEGRPTSRPEALVEAEARVRRLRAPQKPTNLSRRLLGSRKRLVQPVPMLSPKISCTRSRPTDGRLRGCGITENAFQSDFLGSFCTKRQRIGLRCTMLVIRWFCLLFRFETSNGLQEPPILHLRNGTSQLYNHRWSSRCRKTITENHEFGDKIIDRSLMANYLQKNGLMIDDRGRDVVGARSRLGDGYRVILYCV